MTNHPNRSGEYELTFWGSVPAKYRRWHKTAEAAEIEAKRVLADLPNRAAHPAIIYGPDLGKSGRTIN